MGVAALATISRNGMMTNEEYHAHPAIGASGLKLLARSPLHYWAAYIDPEREPMRPSAAMALGTATHCAILEPHRFDDLYTVMPEGLDRRTTQGKALWAEIEATGKQVLKADDFDRLMRMRTAVSYTPDSVHILGHVTEFEQSLFWHDDMTSVACKIRPDIYVAPCAEFPAGLIADLKTTSDASPAAFGRQAWGLMMPIQAALYTAGAQIALSLPQRPAFAWIAVESDRPHAVMVYHAPDDVIAYGDREVARLLELYARCCANDEWPAYGDAQPLTLPGYAVREITETEGDVESIGYV